ncbi:kinetochore-associated Ndc80 complex subunit ndc80 [Exophiala xenobiotica]|nr:kinetochore-associated Ndc80 complex subunit ndc80 [Exophiala xenobiotica]KAK5435783.1 kinetochore-associated Ndc80 complex subunit ndc80 [Exophiala xenobiotica]KAK5555485.1 kinetochore-associated Ndc80 complex subunit ndc80 [Exophiala xenobiotica]
MSQPPGMFSVRRPRETLGNIQNFSGIPQPASAVKRVSSSNELRNAPYTASHIRSTSINQSVQRPAQPNFHRSSSGGNLADMGMSTARRSTVSSNVFGSANTGRQSLAPNQLFGSQTPASQSLQRRSSIFSRPSGHGPVAHQSFFSQPPAPGIAPKDPRPLRDSSYRARLSQELLDYLTQNNFELEMKHSLTQNSVKSPTQKDFTFMFQWLYRRIDPGYKFQKSIDTEVPPIMKQLRYPYERDITKSHLVAVGGQNWPRFLGLLHWMMQLAQMLDNFTRGAYDDACVEAGVDVVSDRIVFRFLFGAYQDWLQMGPEDDEESEQAALQPHIQAMTDEFERTNAKHAGELKIYEAEHEALKAQVEEFERNAPDVAKLDKHFKILEDDKKKFEEYNANVQAKIEKYDSRIKILEAEIQRTEADLQVVEQERQGLQQSVDRQGLNIQDIDRMNTERERLTKSHEDALVMLDEVNKKVLEKEAETARKLEDLEAMVKRYNSLGYQMSLIPSTAVNAKGTDYELSLNIADSFSSSTSTSRRARSSPDSADRLLADNNVGYSPVHLLNLDLRGLVRNAFIGLRKEINERRKAAADADLNARDFLDNISEALHEKNTEIDNLNYRVNEASRMYASLKESQNTTHTQQTSAIEKLEKELARMREGLERGVVELEQREMEVGVAWESMREEAARVREELHSGVERCLEDVIRFKVHVQKGLEEFEGWVGEEVEVELLGDEMDGLELDGKDDEGEP